MKKLVQNYVESYFPFKKKKAIEDYDFIMVFDDYFKDEVEMHFAKIKCQNDFQVHVVENEEEKQTLFLIKIQDHVVDDQAHQLKILKKKTKRSYSIKLKDINTVIYGTTPDSSNHFYNYLCWIRARYNPENKMIYEQQQYSAFNKKKKDHYIKEPDGTLFTQQEQMNAKYNFLITYKEYEEKSQLKIKKETSQNNEDDQEEKVFKSAPFVDLLRHHGFKQLVPVMKVSQHRPFIFGSIKQSAGPNIQCYFDFLKFLEKWLLFPMIIGVLTAGFNYFYEFTAEDSPADFVYAFFIMIWSIFFITKWEEVLKWKTIQQSSGRNDAWLQYQNIIDTTKFQRRMSIVTGKIEYYLTFKKLIYLKVVSFTICASLVVLTLVFMVFSLNARGFIDPTHKLFYSQTVSKWAEEGGIFDANTFWGQIPNIFHVVITNGFDEMIYRPIAKKLAKFQRHLTPKGHESSIITKYFIYEFLITFADLFYIAFVRFDIVGLREQLFSLFFIDIIRRIVAESLIPWLKKTYRSKSLKSRTMQMTYEEEVKIGAILEVNKEDHELFDDYLEIITNIGYLVMISSCFPLAPLLIMIAHVVEIFQDRYKIVHIFKRKLPQKYVGMGDWKNIIIFLCYLSVITNIMLFAFSSQQIVSVFPKMFEGGKDLLYGNTDISTLFGGAANNLFQSMVDISLLNATNITSTGWGDYFPDFIPDSEEENLSKLVEPSLFPPQTTQEPKANEGMNLLFGGQVPEKSSESQEENLLLGIKDSQKIPENQGVNLLFGAKVPQKAAQTLQTVIQEEKKVEEAEILSPGLNLLASPPSEEKKNDEILKLFSGGLGEPQQPETLETFKPLTKENQTTFVTLLFIIEHVFLGLFVLIRKAIASKQSQADIYLKRKQYKRRIKKHLSRDVLSTLIASQLIVNEILFKRPESSIKMSSSSDEEKMESKSEQKEKEAPFLFQNLVKLTSKQEQKQQSEEKVKSPEEKLKME